SCGKAVEPGHAPSPKPGPARSASCATTTLRRPAIHPPRSLCHPLTLSPCHLVTLSPCHPLHRPPCLPAAPAPKAAPPARTPAEPSQGTGEPPASPPTRRRRAGRAGGGGEPDGLLRCARPCRSDPRAARSPAPVRRRWTLPRRSGPNARWSGPDPAGSRRPLQQEERRPLVAIDRRTRQGRDQNRQRNGQQEADKAEEEPCDGEREKRPHRMEPHGVSHDARSDHGSVQELNDPEDDGNLQ